MLSLRRTHQRFRNRSVSRRFLRKPCRTTLSFFFGSWVCRFVKRSSPVPKPAPWPLGRRWSDGRRTASVIMDSEFIRTTEIVPRFTSSADTSMGGRQDSMTYLTSSRDRVDAAWCSAVLPSASRSSMSSSLDGRSSETRATDPERQADCTRLRNRAKRLLTARTPMCPGPAASRSRSFCSLPRSPACAHSWACSTTLNRFEFARKARHARWMRRAARSRRRNRWMRRAARILVARRRARRRRMAASKATAARR
mmetsp:Transcript_23752/g.69551  ORF Transcript_23752/g.69551 Transcript_23752/m.69551 type:complete len:253 (-) Transcript_23752:1386-2144(-)